VVFCYDLPSSSVVMLDCYIDLVDLDMWLVEPIQ